MNNLITFNVKLPNGQVEQIISNIFNLKKEIFKYLDKYDIKIPTDNIILFDDDDQLNIYSSSTLLSTQFSQQITVIDAHTLIKELMQMNALKQQYEKNLLEYEKVVNIVQMLNVDCARKDSEINVLKSNQIQQNSTIQDLRVTLGEYEDKYRALFQEYGQLKNNHQKLDENFKKLKDQNNNNELKISNNEKIIFELKEQYQIISQEKNNLIEELNLKTLEFNCKFSIQEQKFERLDDIKQQLKNAGIEKLQDSKHQRNLFKCESKQVELMKKAQQEANNLWQQQINKMQNELNQIKQEKLELEHNSQVLQKQNRELQVEKYEKNQQLIQKENQVQELNKIKNEQSLIINQQEEKSIELTQLQQDLQSIQNYINTLKKQNENQKLALEKAKQYMRYQDKHQSCIQKLYCEDIGTIFQKEGLQIDDKVMKIFKIEKGDKFQSFFEIQDFYRLEHALKLVELGSVKIRRSINPIVQDGQHQGFFMEIIDDKPLKDCKCKYLLNLQYLKDVNAFFYQEQEAAAQALNHIIVDEYLKVFLQDMTNIQYQNFKVATSYILQENISQFYYCVRIDQGINQRINTDFPQAFRNYVLEKSSQNLFIGNMTLISHTIHDVQIQTQYGFLTEQDRGLQSI